MPRLYEDLKVATLLPAAEALTRSKFPDARKMIEAKVTIAIATDCNPGSSYTTSMPHCLSLAVSHMGMTPAEAMHAATYGGAMALENEDVGRLETGSAADFVVIDAPHYSYLMYRPGIPHIRQTWQSGKLIYDRDIK
jgi:imidazolonepropionase